jgi:hypothetical protein
MFKCEYSKTISNPYEKPVKLVIQKRTKQYYEMRINPETKFKEEVQVGEGWEIVKEIQVRSLYLEQAKERYGIE